MCIDTLPSCNPIGKSDAGHLWVAGDLSSKAADLDPIDTWYKGLSRFDDGWVVQKESGVC